MNASDDKTLIAAWKAGDERAATALVARHTDYLTRLAYSFRVQNDVEELVQDVFVRAFDALGSFRGDTATFRSWLSIIMRRLILDRGRKERRARLSDPIEAANDVPARGHGALADMIANETGRRLFAALHSEDRKRLLRMKLAGYRWPEIATAFGVEEITMRGRFTRIRRVLLEVAA